MIEEIKNIAQNNFPKIIEVRRYLHQNPELSFKEFNTSKYIQSILSEHLQMDMLKLELSLLYREIIPWIKKFCSGLI